jgi:hypothetical protein
VLRYRDTLPEGLRAFPHCELPEQIVEPVAGDKFAVQRCKLRRPVVERVPCAISDDFDQPL